MKRIFSIKEKEFGAGRFLICIPIISSEKQTIIEDFKDAVDLNPDLVEWRVDYFEDNGDVEKIKDVLYQIKELTQNIPVIFTCRHQSEGGECSLNPEIRYNMFREALETGVVDFLDIEMLNGEGYINSIRKLKDQYGKKLILSYHNFQTTPDEQLIVDKLLEGQSLGADIVKVALMPNTPVDVMTLLSATGKAWENIDIPMITMAMGDLGRVSRVWGNAFGSEITFASMRQSSAPGQIEFGDLKRIIELFSKDGAQL
ncbi:MAG: type I 3-dehydroquinate dehydratase [Dethiosulfatibacter sp.]|nr:type I 3-dehydroquinate dehydratase [Dethiosulfatibacter sp.]